MNEIKIFVINLKTSKEKRSSIINELEKLSLRYEVLDAINGVELNDQQIQENLYLPRSNYLTKGEIGCALSHQKIYKKMIKENLDYALILEDDVKLSNDLPNFLKVFYQTKKNNPQKKEIFLLQQSKYFFSNKKIELNKNYIFHESFNAKGTYGYLISNKAAQSILKINHPLILEADHWLGFYELCFLKVFSLNKNLVFLNKNFIESSTIDPQRRDDKYKTHSKIKKSILKNKFRYKLIRTYHKFFRSVLLTKKINSNFHVEYK